MCEKLWLPKGTEVWAGCTLLPCTMIKHVPLQTSSLWIRQQHAKFVLPFGNKSNFLLGVCMEVWQRTKYVHKTDLIWYAYTSESEVTAFSGFSSDYSCFKASIYKLAHLRKVCLIRYFIKYRSVQISLPSPDTQNGFQPGMVTSHGAIACNHISILRLQS